jgi:hypothetical protein
MKKEEKARELVNKFYALQSTIEIDWTKDEELIKDAEKYLENEEAKKYWLELAKKSAVLSVMEIREVAEEDYYWDEEEGQVFTWKELIEEIESL